MSSASDTSLTEEIRLKRGKRGLGFNIVGGTDHQYNYNDSAIYVSKIQEDGPADADGRLKEGDQILAINGRVLRNMTHLEVVEVFRNSGDEAVLQVVKKISDKNNQSNGPTISPLVLTALVVVVAIFGYVKYHHRS